MFNMQALGSYGGLIEGCPSGAAYTPSSTGLLTGVALADILSLQGMGFVVVPGPGSAASTVAGAASTATGAGAIASLVGGAGGATSGAGGNAVVAGGAAVNGNSNGGDVHIDGGAKHGSGTVGNVIMGSLPTADPHVVGALWASTGVVTVSAG